ncbi:Uncharacterised protein [Streptococcus pneumoniae]|nr:Uncharacterised protein [Streptococcus pneumoniae]
MATDVIDVNGFSWVEAGHHDCFMRIRNSPFDHILQTIFEFEDRTCQVTCRFEACSSICNDNWEFSQHIISVFQSPSCHTVCDKSDVFCSFLFDKNFASLWIYVVTITDQLCIGMWQLVHGSNHTQFTVSQPTHSIVGMHPNTRSSIDCFFGFIKSRV